MPEGKTIGQLMEEMRQKAGAQNYHGHDYMDLQRFAENTRHMIIFDVLTHDSPVRLLYRIHVRSIGQWHPVPASCGRYL